jgi:sortase A
MIANKSGTRNGYQGLELGLWLISALCFGTLAYVAVMAADAKRVAQSITAAPGLLRVETEKTGSIGLKKELVSSAVLAPASEVGQVIGRMEIPALSLSVPITSGVETSSLLSGVGHVDGSAVPGGLGTIVLAGHRDTFLRPLEHVAKGMEILITDRVGTYHYLVDRWEIVFPEQVESIAIRSRPELALVTCYPFHFVGAAPRRFVVHANLVSLVPDAGADRQLR